MCYKTNGQQSAASTVAINLSSPSFSRVKTKCEIAGRVPTVPLLADTKIDDWQKFFFPSKIFPV
jgi:hypothetical protein